MGKVSVLITVIISLLLLTITQAASDWCDFALPLGSYCTGNPQYTELDGKVQLNGEESPAIDIAAGQDTLHIELNKPVNPQYRQFPMFATGYVYKKDANGVLMWQPFTFNFEADVSPITEPFDILPGETPLWYDISTAGQVAATADIPLSANDAGQSNFVAAFICRCSTRTDCLRPGNPTRPNQPSKWECNPKTVDNQGIHNGRWVLREFTYAGTEPAVCNDGETRLFNCASPGVDCEAEFCENGQWVPGT